MPYRTFKPFVFIEQKVKDKERYDASLREHLYPELLMAKAYSPLTSDYASEPQFPLFNLITTSHSGARKKIKGSQPLSTPRHNPANDV
jgi:hypothetical protein